MQPSAFSRGGKPARCVREKRRSCPFLVAGVKKNGHVQVSEREAPYLVWWHLESADLRGNGQFNLSAFACEQM